MTEVAKLMFQLMLSNNLPFGYLEAFCTSVQLQMILKDRFILTEMTGSFFNKPSILGLSFLVISSHFNNTKKCSMDLLQITGKGYTF